jgi:hypothetical protein
MGGLCLVQRFGKMSDTVRVLLGIFGNMIVGVAWYYAVAPRVGLSAILACWPLEIFLGVHVLFLLMRFSRQLETAEL